MQELPRSRLLKNPHARDFRASNSPHDPPKIAPGCNGSCHSARVNFSPRPASNEKLPCPPVPPNSQCPLLDADNGIFSRPETARQLAAEIVCECVTLAGVEGIFLTEAEVMEQI